MEYHINDILIEHGVLKFGDFTLAKGKKSKYYVDIRKVVTRPKTLKLICDCIIRKMRSHFLEPDYIACTELGAVPIGVMISDRTNLPLIIVRKAEKDHGEKGRLMGFETGIDPTGIVLLLEDVTTTGGSVLSAANALKNEGLIIEAIMTIVDREEGAKTTISGAGIIFIPLTTIEGLLKDNHEGDSVAINKVL